MTKSDLTIVSVAARESGFINLMIESVCTFTDPKPNFIICDNGQNGKHLTKYNNDENITVVRHKRMHKYNRSNKFSTNMKHAIGLNVALKMVKTKRVAIIESDCVVLRDNWDKIPAGYEMRACVKGVGVKGEHYYYPCFMVFYNECINRNGKMDFMTNKKKFDHSVGIVISEKDGFIKKYSDVGWRIYEHIQDEKVDKLKRIHCSNPKSKEFNKVFSHKSNVFLDNEDNIIAAHFWRGSDLARRSTNVMSVKKQKKMWFSVTRQFINKKKQDKE